MFELDNVAKRYGATQALSPTRLSIAAGGTTVLIGPSGSGKSTLLRLMMGLVAPDAGEVRFDGQHLGRCNVQTLRRRMGYVVQQGGLFPHMTAKANITLMARQQGWPARRIEARLTELATMTQLPASCLAHYPAQLSGGQRQRVGLMRALMLDPAVLLLDEPLGALDPMIRYELQNDLAAIFSTLAKTVVLVTHDISEAGFFADTIVLLHDGRIIQQGCLNELLESPADSFVQRFVTAQRTLLTSSRP